MKIKFTEEEIYEVILMGGTVLVLTDVNEDLIVNGSRGACYEDDESMEAVGLGSLIGKNRVYPFSLDVVGEYLID